jgi:hypothetical protein
MFGRLRTFISGNSARKHVGTDRFGNKYFTEMSGKGNTKLRQAHDRIFKQKKKLLDFLEVKRFVEYRGILQHKKVSGFLWGINGYFFCLQFRPFRYQS